MNYWQNAKENPYQKPKVPQSISKCHNDNVDIFLN